MVDIPMPLAQTAQNPTNQVAARMRVGEERVSELRKKLLVVENNLVSNHKRAMEEIKLIHTEMNELRKTIQTVEDRIITVIKELRLTARKEDIDVMKKYIEIWDPVKFVTSDRVEEIVNRKMNEASKKEN